MRDAKVRRTALFCSVLIATLALAGRPAAAAVCTGLSGGPGDIDGDGFAAAADCDDSNPALWSLPGEARNVRVPAGSKHTFVWDAPADLGGSSVAATYEALRSRVASNFLDDPSVTCLDTGGSDLQLTDPTNPPSGVVFFYLVRARSSCGAGSLGTRRNGVPRVGRECDAAVLCNDGNSCTADRAVDGVCFHDPVPPKLVHAPAPTAACAGGRAGFKVDVSGQGAAHYVWRKNGVPVGFDNPFLLLTPVSPADNGAQITVTVTDGCSNATSDAVSLTVFSDAASCAGGLDGQEAPNSERAFRTRTGHRVIFEDSRGDVARVATHSGELFFDMYESSIDGRGFDFVWNPRYRSREWRASAMGNGWTQPYDRRVAADPAHPGQLLVFADDSRIDSFAPAVSGCYEAPGFFETLCPQVTGGYTLTFPDGIEWSFAPLDGSPAQGRILEARDQYDNAMTFVYDGLGRLDTIIDTLGRPILIAYNSRSLIDSVTDFAGRSIHYSYYDGVEPGGALDDLKSVTSPPVTGTPTGNDFPQGKSTTFTYSSGFATGEMNHNLLSVTDGLGKQAIVISYSLSDSTSDPAFDRLYRFEVHTGSSVYRETYAYVAQSPVPANGFAVSKTVVKDPEGNVEEAFFDAQARLVMTRDLTGRAPNVDGFVGDVDNRPAGPLRPSDPPYFETRMEYNGDSLPTQVVDPNGNDVVWTYDSANPSARKRGDLLHETIHPGPLGGDQAQIDRSWIHATSFGTDWGGRGDIAAGGSSALRERSKLVWSPKSNFEDGGGGGGGESVAQNPLYTGGGLSGNNPFYEGGSAKLGGAIQQAEINNQIVPAAAKSWPAIFDEVADFEHDSSAGRVYLVKTPRTVVQSTSVLKKEEGGRHTPFHNRYRPSALIAGFLSKKGYDYYQVARGFAPLAVDLPDPDLERPAFAGKKGYDYYKMSGRDQMRRDGRSKRDSGSAVDRRRRDSKSTAQLRRRDANSTAQLRRRDGMSNSDRASRASGFPTSYTDPAGQVWTLAYDAGGGLTDFTAPPVVTGTLSGAVQTIHHAWAYDGSGRLTQYTDPEGRVVQFDYFTSGPATGYLRHEVVDPLGLALTTTYERDSLGRVTRVTDPNGHATDFSLDSGGNLVRVVDSAPFSYQTDFYYDAADRLVRSDVENVDESGAVRANHHLSTGYDYDDAGRITRVRREVDAPQCVMEEFQWTGNDQLTLWKDGQAASGAQPSNNVRVLYDERSYCFRLRVSDGGAEASTTQFDYDGNGNLAALREGLEAAGGPNVTTWQHDGYGRAAQSTDAEGNVVSLHYDPRSDVVSVRLDGELEDGASGSNVRLAEASCLRDEAGRLVKCECSHFKVASGAPIGDGTSTAQVYYDASSRVIRGEDDNLHGADYAYDAAGRLSHATNPRGDTLTVAYDSASNVTAVTEVELSDIAALPPATYVTQFEYDALDRPTAVVDNLGARRESDFDSRNLVVGTRDALGNVTRTTFDGLSRPTRRERDLTDTGTGSGTVTGTVVTTQAWDDSSRLASTTDATGNPTTYGYDGRNQLVSVQRADGNARTRAFDVHGNLVAAADPNGSTQTLTYDRRNRLRTRSIVRAPGVLGTTSESYAYDGASRLVRATDDDSVVARAYDSLSNVVQESQQTGAGPVRVSSSTRDGVGNMTSVSYPSGLPVTYTYDAIDRIKTVAVGPALVASYDYAGPDSLAQITRANGVTTHYVRDGMKRVVSQSDTAGAPLFEQTFGWSPASDRLSWSVPSAGRSHTYAYDSLHRLQQSTRSTSGPPEVASYSLDAFGRRVSVTGGPDAGPYTMSPALPEPADFQVHQYTTTPRGSRQYDRNGNTLTIDGASPTERTLAYDYRGQLARIARPGATLDYGRDALGRALSRAGASDLESVWSGAREIEQYVAGTLQADFVYGVGGAPLQMIEQVDLNSNSVLDQYYYHTDSGGSVVAVSDQGAVVRESYDYGDYQQPRVFDGGGQPLASSAVGNPFLGGGRRWEPSQSLYADGFDPRAGVALRGLNGEEMRDYGFAFAEASGQVCLAPGGGTGGSDPGTGPGGEAQSIIICWYDQWGYWNCIVVEGQGPGMFTN